MISCKRDDLRFDLFDKRQQSFDLIRLAAARDDDDNIVSGHLPQITMDRLSAVHPQARRARRRQSRRDLTPDDPRFPHAGDNHAPLALGDHIHRFLKTPVDAPRQFLDSLRFDPNNLFCFFKRHDMAPLS